MYTVVKQESLSKNFHISSSKVILDDRKYEPNDNIEKYGEVALGLKPVGFWVNTDNSKNEEYGPNSYLYYCSNYKEKEPGYISIGKMNYIYNVIFDQNIFIPFSENEDIKKIVQLDNISQLEDFSKIYGTIVNIGEESFIKVDWSIVSKDYAGVYVSCANYDFSESIFRQTPIPWYARWDFPSFCLWDTSLITLEEIEVEKRSRC